MHRHKWIIKSQETHPSPIEQMSKDGKLGDLKVRGYGFDLFTKDVIVTKWCETCGTEKVERI